MQNGILRATLANGLQVVLKEIHTAPLISHWVWYRVGARDEYTGITGASHWVEHMQFKGTPRFAAGVPDRMIARLGGTWNAFTSSDWTAYYETLPADQIGLALSLESDRMRNSLFDPQELDLERTVIISERQGSENEPLFLLSEEINAAAFRVHPYHHDVVGDLADLQNMTRDDLYNHYQRYYIPGNAVLALAGDFNAEEMLEQVRQAYEAIPAGPLPQRRLRPEPPQNGERRVVVEGPGETAYLQISYRAPAAQEADFFALSALGSLLAGPSSLSSLGGGISNKTSRLYRALVENELATSVFGDLQATIDPYLHTLIAIIHPSSTPDAVLEAIDGEIARLQDAPPAEADLARAVKQARALFAYGAETITNQAFWLGFPEMFDSYAWYERYLERLGAVTPQDVQHAAQTYLRRQQRVVGTYQPVAPQDDAEDEE